MERRRSTRRMNVWSKLRYHLSLVVAGALLAPTCGMAAEGDPLGPQFTVNTTIANYQGRLGGVATAPLENGGFVVVWTTYGGTVYDVSGRRFDATGEPLGTEFAVIAAADEQGYRDVAVAGLADGGFVVVWDDEAAPGGSEFDVVARRFNSTGTPDGAAFLVNTTTADRQGDNIAVERLGDGSFVIVWTTLASSDADVAARRFSSTGSSIGTEFMVNTVLAGEQGYGDLDVAGLKDGGFIVAWSDDEAPGGSGMDVSAQRFASSGTPVGPQLLLNGSISGSQGDDQIVIAGLEDGGFVAAWSESGSPSFDVAARLFDSAGSPIGTDFLVNTGQIGDQGEKALAAAGVQGGGFVIAWSDSNAPGGDSYDVAAQRFDSSGGKSGTQFLVNSVVANYQGEWDVAIANLNDGAFAVVWDDDASGFDSNVSARLFEGPGCKSTPLDGCGRPAKTLIKVKQDTDPTKRQLLWKWLGGTIDIGDFGDPEQGETDYALCVYDDADLVSSPRVSSGGTCAGKPCWKSTAVGFKYGNSDTNSSGVFKLQLKSGAGNGKILLKARGVNLDPPVPMTQSSAVRVQLVRADGVACWESFFTPPATKDDSTSFKDKEDTQPQCGNSAIEPGEDCEGSNLNGASCASVGHDGGTLACNAGACKFDTAGCFDNKIVFVTSSASSGDLGGISSADDRCQSFAFLGGLPGTYKAWLADDTSSPSTTFAQSAHPYVLVDGTVVASDWADLTDGTLQTAIDLDETGSPAPFGADVWTNVQDSGTGNGGLTDCGNWTTSSNGSVGRTALTNSVTATWTETITVATCNTLHRLYCFQQ